MIDRQFLIFVSGGILCAVIDVSTMELLISAGFNPVFSATSGFVLGLLVNYLFHANLTFRSTTTVAKLAKFLSIVGINYTLTIAFVLSFAFLFGSALAGKIASLPVVALNGFLLSKYWAFRR